MTLWLRNRVVDLPVDITWIRQLGDEWWGRGGLVHISTVKYMRLFFNRLGGDMDRRLHRRYPFCHPFSALPCAENQDTYENVPELQEKTPTVISMDVSYGGIRLVCEGSIGANGHIVHLKNKDGDEDGRVIRGRITSCHELENGCYATGIQFAPSRINMTNVID